jgi:hypothetical protein
MNRFTHSIVTLIVAAAPAVALAQQQPAQSPHAAPPAHSQSSHSGSSWPQHPAEHAPPVHAAPPQLERPQHFPAARNAPPDRYQSPGRYVPQNLYAPSQVYSPQRVDAPAAGHPTQPGDAHKIVPSRPIYARAPLQAPYQSGPYRNWHGPVVENPHHWHHWGWHHGNAWYPVANYWGGGFWGPWDLDDGGLVLFGSIVDYDDYAIFPSYEIQDFSPGAQLLEDYGLQQTECGPPNLVVIWGPGNSVICAYPNELVAPGNYELDPDTLTIQSLGDRR